LFDGYCRGSWHCTAIRRHTGRKRHAFKATTFSHVRRHASGTTSSAARAEEAQFVTRPAAELFGAHPSFRFTGDEVNTATGNYTHSTVDLDFGGGLLAWERTHNSLDAGTSPLGRGWTTTFSAHLVENGRGTP
jgi:hypothetical protein